MQVKGIQGSEEISRLAKLLQLRVNVMTAWLDSSKNFEEAVQATSILPKSTDVHNQAKLTEMIESLTSDTEDGVKGMVASWNSVMESQKALSAATKTMVGMVRGAIKRHKAQEARQKSKAEAAESSRKQPAAGTGKERQAMRLLCCAKTQRTWHLTAVLRALRKMSQALVTEDFF